MWSPVVTIQAPAPAAPPAPVLCVISLPQCWLLTVTTEDTLKTLKWLISGWVSVPGETQDTAGPSRVLYHNNAGLVQSGDGSQ